MDEKVDQTQKIMNETRIMNYKQLNIPEINLDELNKKTHTIVSPRSPQAHVVTKSSSTRSGCLCSPTTHAGSFRCRRHRSLAIHRGWSVGSNLSELARKSGPMSDSFGAQ